MSRYTLKVALLLCISMRLGEGRRIDVDLADAAEQIGIASSEDSTSRTSRQDYLGYLFRSGDALRFRWSDAPVEGALASLTPADGVIEKLIRWNRVGAATPIKRPVTTASDFFIGLTSFFRYARKNGVYVTMLEPVATVALFLGEGHPAQMMEVGQAFNIGNVSVIGATDPRHKLTILTTMSGLQKGLFQNAITETGGSTVSLASMPVLTSSKAKDVTVEKHPSTPDGAEKEAVEPSKQVEERSPVASVQAGQGCYLVLEWQETASGAKAYSVATKWSKEPVEGAVAFFEPSLSQVPPTSWKYNNGGKRRVVFTHTMSGGGKQVPRYYESWISFLNEGRKMEGKFSLLPIADEDFATQVLFQEKGEMEIIRSTVGQPVDLMDKGVVAVINAANSEKVSFFDGTSNIESGIFMREATNGKDGSVTTWE